MTYRGRLAPTPSGYLHLGHARTFAIAHERARAAGGTLVYRNEDLDAARCKPELAAAAVDDLRWLGLDWDEGPVDQSARLPLYRDAFRALNATGTIYPSPHSRKDVERALSAPHAEEPIFPPSLRMPPDPSATDPAAHGGTWRFRVPDGRAVSFVDGHAGPTSRVAGVDFGDFLVWRRDGFPSYELAVVVDDHAMGITEVVRGADLLTSTARQLLLYEAFGWPAPAFHHCDLVLDASGKRLAKRDDALSLRALRAAGKSPADVRALWR